MIPSATWSPPPTPARRGGTYRRANHPTNVLLTGRAFDYERRALWEQRAALEEEFRPYMQRSVMSGYSAGARS